MTGAFSSMSIVGILFSVLSGFYRLRLIIGTIWERGRELPRISLPRLYEKWFSEGISLL
jgi:hypothetical protein